MKGTEDKGNLIPFGKFVKLFPQVTPKALLWWVTQGLIPFSDSREDGRGLIRLFSLEDIAQAAVFVSAYESGTFTESREESPAKTMARPRSRKSNRNRRGGQTAPSFFMPKFRFRLAPPPSGPVKAETLPCSGPG